MTMINQTRQSASPVAPRRGLLRPLGIDEVTITGGFWGERQRVNGTATLAHIHHWLEKEGWLANFDLAAAGTLPEGRRGREFSDSEVYKYLEAMAWEIGRTGDSELEARFASVVERVAAAQEADGYLNTRFGRPGQAARWTELEWGHELYCLGHLFQAAVARVRTVGSDDELVRVARRAADLVCDVFGAVGIQSICGHAEVEVGLAELGRATGETRYLEQARIFVERHGQQTLPDIELGRDYFQDDMPVRDATVLRGHAVRANYLSAAAVDVAVESADEPLLAALTTQWDNTIARRTYVTGGQGSHHTGEAFGEDWVLPPDRAYSETCAGVGSIMFSWRLLLAQGSPKYADLIERTLFNVVATSASTEGTSFFYANTLHRRTPDEPVAMDQISPRASSSARAPWFEVSCCPPNVARTFASLAGYLATVDDGGVQLHQYAPAEIRTALADGRAIAIDVQTEYPRDGAIRVVVRETPASPWTLTLRVPSWAPSARLVVTEADGGVEESEVGAGATAVTRAFSVGDVVELVLPMAPRFTVPDRHIDAIRGTLTVERGPEVLCLESVDLDATAFAGMDIADLELDTTVPPREVDGRVIVRLQDSSAPVDAWPYEGAGTAAEPAGPAADVALIPYHDWASRGPSAMRVWMPAVTP